MSDVYRVFENRDGYEIFVTDLHKAIKLFIDRAIEFSPDMSKFGTSGVCQELCVDKITFGADMWKKSGTILAFAPDGTFFGDDVPNTIARNLLALRTTPVSETKDTKSTWEKISLTFGSMRKTDGTPVLTIGQINGASDVAPYLTTFSQVVDAEKMPTFVEFQDALRFGLYGIDA